MGIRDRPIAPASPWHNGIAERLIGTLRRECLDPPIWHITIRLARIWLYTKMRPYGEPSNGLAELSPSPFWPGYITNMSGYNFRKGHVKLCRPKVSFPS